MKTKYLYYCTMAAAMVCGCGKTDSTTEPAPDAEPVDEFRATAQRMGNSVKIAWNALGSHEDMAGESSPSEFYYAQYWWDATTYYGKDEYPYYDIYYTKSVMADNPSGEKVFLASVQYRTGSGTYYLGTPYPSINLRYGTCWKSSWNFQTSYVHADLQPSTYCYYIKARSSSAGSTDFSLPTCATIPLSSD